MFLNDTHYIYKLIPYQPIWGSIWREPVPWFWEMQLKCDDEQGSNCVLANSC